MHRDAQDRPAESSANALLSVGLWGIALAIDLRVWLIVRDPANACSGPGWLWAVVPMSLVGLFRVRLHFDELSDRLGSSDAAHRHRRRRTIAVLLVLTALLLAGVVVVWLTFAFRSSCGD